MCVFAGCLLYFMIYAISPFERVLGEAGGSLYLAVANGEVKWPMTETNAAPEQLRKLILKCLVVDMAQRPEVQIILDDAETLEQCLQHEN